MISIRQSHLEAFRRVVETAYGDERALIDAILGKPHPPSWQMAAGSAWHMALEGREPDEALEQGVVRHGSYFFSVEHIAQGVAALGPGVREIPGRRVFDVWGCPVELTGTADHMRGLVITDSKTKFSPADARDYESSLQWRAYMLIHEAVCFRYCLFSFSDPDGGGFCALKDMQSFRFWPYVGMEQDVRRWLGSFLDWAHQHRLTSYLERSLAYEETAA